MSRRIFHVNHHAGEPEMAAKTPQQGQTENSSKDQVQGEGDYEAGRRYDKAAHEFAQSGKVERAAHDAAPGSDEEAEKMQQAEQEGKSHSKGEGPLVSKKRKA
jgi:hypothetical protein